jgi:hypothetical protein
MDRETPRSVVEQVLGAHYQRFRTAIPRGPGHAQKCHIAVKWFLWTLRLLRTRRGSMTETPDRERPLFGRSGGLLLLTFRFNPNFEVYSLLHQLG